MPPGDGPPGLKPSLKTSTSTDSQNTSQSNGSSKAVQILDPESESISFEDIPFRKQNKVRRISAPRLSGRMPFATNLSRSSLATVTSTDVLQAQLTDATSTPGLSGVDGPPSPSALDAMASPPPSAAPSSVIEFAPGSTPTASSPAMSPIPQTPVGSQSRSRYHQASEMMIARIGEWLDHERRKAERRTGAYHSPKSRTTGQPAKAVDDEGLGRRERSDSIDSQSSDVSLDRLQRILDDSMSNLGLSSVPPLRSLLSKKVSGRLRKGHPRPYQMSRAPSSDTDYVDGDAIVPSCEAMLDNSKAMSFHGGFASTDDLSLSSRSKKESRGRLGWTSFKNEVIRLAHTLRLKGWRSVALDGGDKISIERLSGALTNAVYVISPPKDSDLVQPSSRSGTPTDRKPPPKILLRIYGPHVDQLIDRQTELKVLQRLARKKIGPRLLGTFTNGRFEEYFNAAALNFTDLRDPETSRQIAKRMRELHDGIELLEDERDGGPNVWRNWDKWLDNVGKRVVLLDDMIKSGDTTPQSSRDAWKSNGFVCGVEWKLFKELVDRHRAHVIQSYRDPGDLRDHLVFAHNDTQYGNILRHRPDDQKSPLLQPANKHKQLIVIDFEYAAANVAGLEFANHFTEWCYDYHSETTPFACVARHYPTPEEQYRFIKAYVDHRPQYPHAGSTPRLMPLDALPPSSAQAASSSSIVDFMLDARGSGVPSWTEEERAREEKSDAAVRELTEETKLWRAANSAQWVAWGIIQAKMGAIQGVVGGGEGEGAGEGGSDTSHEGSEEGHGEDDEFDYLSYAQDRAWFFLGDCLQLGIVTAEELGPVVDKLKIVDF